MTAERVPAPLPPGRLVTYTCALLLALLVFRIAPFIHEKKAILGHARMLRAEISGLERSNRFDEAIEKARLHLHLLQNATGRVTQGYAEGLESLGALQSRRGTVVEAAASYREASLLWRDALQETDRSIRALVLGAEALCNSGLAGSALELLRQARTIDRTRLSGNDRLTNHLRALEGRALARAGELVQACATLERALKEYSPGSRILWYQRILLGQVLLALGEPVRSVQVLDVARLVWSDGNWSWYRREAERCLALALLEVEDLPTARSTIESACNNARTVWRGGQVKLHATRVTVELAAGRRADAERAARSVASIATTATVTDCASVATSLAQQCETLVQAGVGPAIEPSIERGAARERKVAGESGDWAEMQLALARIRLESDPARARRLLEEALAVMERPSNRTVPDAIRCRRVLALAFEKLGDRRAALAHLAGAHEAARRVFTGKGRVTREIDREIARIRSGAAAPAR